MLRVTTSTRGYARRSLALSCTGCQPTLATCRQSLTHSGSLSPTSHDGHDDGTLICARLSTMMLVVLQRVAQAYALGLQASQARDRRDREAPQPQPLLQPPPRHLDAVQEGLLQRRPCGMHYYRLCTLNPDAARILTSPHVLWSICLADLIPACSCLDVESWRRRSTTRSRRISKRISMSIVPGVKRSVSVSASCESNYRSFVKLELVTLWYVYHPLLLLATVMRSSLSSSQASCRCFGAHYSPLPPPLL